MARKKVAGSREPVARKKKKKTTRKKTARIKTAAQIAQTDDEQLEIENGKSEIETPPGIVCPRCGCQDLRAPDGRPWEVTHTERKYGFIRRRRVCRYCGKIVITRERNENGNS